MVWPSRASLNSQELPPQFSYKPYINKKRNSVSATAGAVITQYADPQLVHGDGSIAWTIELAKPTEFQTLYNLYDTTAPTLYVFSGYWGDSYEVFFTVFDPPTVRGRIWSLSGQLQVISILSDFNAVC